MSYPFRDPSCRRFKNSSRKFELFLCVGRLCISPWEIDDLCDGESEPPDCRRAGGMDVYLVAKVCVVGEEYVRWCRGARGTGVNSTDDRLVVKGGGSGTGSQICGEALGRGVDLKGMTGISGSGIGTEPRDLMSVAPSLESGGDRQSGEGELVEDVEMGARNTDGGGEALSWVSTGMMC